MGYSPRRQGNAYKYERMLWFYYLFQVYLNTRLICSICVFAVIIDRNPQFLNLSQPLSGVTASGNWLCLTCLGPFCVDLYGLDLYAVLFGLISWLGLDTANERLPLSSEQPQCSLVLDLTNLNS